MTNAIDRSGPKRFELLFAPPSSLTHFVKMSDQNKTANLKTSLPWVVHADWNYPTLPLSNDEKYIALRKRFVDGQSWVETGIYDHLLRGLAQRQRLAARRGEIGSFDGCRSKEEFEERYKRIDTLFEQVKSEGRLKTAWEVEPGPLAQKYGVRVMIDQNGKFIFAGAGFHRLVIAQTLNLPLIPVALSIIHADAVKNGHLAKLRVDREAVLDKLSISLPKEGKYVSAKELRKK